MEKGIVDYIEDLEYFSTLVRRVANALFEKPMRNWQLMDDLPCLMRELNTAQKLKEEEENKFKY